MVQYEVPLRPGDPRLPARSAARSARCRAISSRFSKIPSFIVTLAGMLVFQGLTWQLLLGQSVGPFPPDFQALSSGFIPDFVRRH